MNFIKFSDLNMDSLKKEGDACNLEFLPNKFLEGNLFVNLNSPLLFSPRNVYSSDSFVLKENLFDLMVKFEINLIYLNGDIVKGSILNLIPLNKTIQVLEKDSFFHIIGSNNISIKDINPKNYIFFKKKYIFIELNASTIYNL